MCYTPLLKEVVYANTERGSDSAIFNSLGACWLHAMVAIERLHEQCGAKRVFAMPYGGCGKSRREAIYWLERTIEIAVRNKE